MKQIKRYVGSLLGLAVGDALGTTLEFAAPGTFAPISEMVGGGPFNLKPGQWTDDTSLALCLAKSLIEKKGFDAIDQLERYLRWYREGYMSSTGKCFDIGTTTLRALLLYEKNHMPICKSPIDCFASNGSLMRLAPVPLFFASDIKEAIVYSGESSLTTHCAIEAFDAARFLGALIAGATNGIRKEELLIDTFFSSSKYWKAQPLTKSIAEISNGSFTKKEPPEITGASNAAKALEAALWAFSKSHSFSEGCLLAVNLGEDADTTGAIYGQLAGAYYGKSEIPQDWIDRLEKRNLIEDIAEDLFRYRL
jgi:ADP-ribosyl-[dinitrogen reductase] hydrolase